MYTFLGVVTALVAMFIAFFKWRFKLFERLGIPTLNPTIPLGDAREALTGKSTMGEQFKKYYDEFKSRKVRHGGVFFSASPQYFPIDPEIIKSVFQTDFQYFMNRGIYVDEINDPLSGHLFSLEDSKWKKLRVKLTPTFTSGKMKMMFNTLKDCGVSLNDIIKDSAMNKSPTEIKYVLARFTTDVIGSVAFGLECNSLKNPDAEFRKFGRKIFEIDTLQKMKVLAPLILPHSFLRWMKLKQNPPDVERFFRTVIEETVEYREKNKIFRKDFMHSLIQLKNRGTVTDDENINPVDEEDLKDKCLTMDELAAQAFVFFAAGFETSSSLMTFALFELSINQDCQNKLRQEIIEVLARFDNEITYEAVMEMKYLDKVLCEALRKYPPLPVTSRRCDADYTIPGTSVQIPKGMMVIVSVLGIHYDPEYYPNPEKFDPERFSDENKAKRPAFTWFPFGEGPRICIGMRFGLLQSKVGLVTLLKDYKFKLNEKTQLPVEFDRQSFILSINGGVWLDVEQL